MKRTKEKTEIEIEDEERQKMFRNQITNAMRHQGNRFLLDPSYASVEELSFGRIAFHGMNPEIEKMMENERLRKEQADAIRNEKDVQDEEMAHFYSRRDAGASNTIGRKFATKQEYQVQSGGHNRPMTAIMTNSDAEKQGETILRHGASLMDSIRGKKRTWGKRAATENRDTCDNISGIADTAKIRKFIRPNDN